ncbi:MAG: CopD family protein [Nitrospiraceae bacterium]|nr:CopD family protein [Nitrospiraceae bacterium]
MVASVAWTFFVLAGFALFMGSTVCRLWVLPRQGGCDGDITIHRRIRALEGLGVLLLIAGAIFGLAARSLEMSGRPMYDIFTVLPVVLNRTHYGTVWKTGAVCILLLLGLWTAGGKLSRLRPYQLFTFAVLLALAATRSAAGHAADKGDFTIPEMADWLHLLSASVWGGGLIILSFAVPPGLSCIEAESLKVPRAAEMVSRFSAMAGAALGMMIITAYYNGNHYVKTCSLATGTGYGQTVLAKMALLGLLVALGGYNRYISLPLLRKLAGYPETGFVYRHVVKRYFSFLIPKWNDDNATEKFVRKVRVEAIIVLIVFLLASMLRHEMPATHVHPMGRTGAGPGMPAMHQGGM